MNGDDIEAVDACDYYSWSPLCGTEQFEDLVQGMVTDEKPRVFAIVQEFGTRLDARVAAWGLAFAGSAHLVGTEGGAIMSSSTPERAARCYARAATKTRPAVTARVVWR